MELCGSKRRGGMWEWGRDNVKDKDADEDEVMIGNKVIGYIWQQSDGK